MINRKICQILDRINNVGDQGVFVCEATEEEWRKYVMSEPETLKSRAMEWRPIQEPAGPQRLHQHAVARRGRIYIVEPPSGLHETLLGEMGASFTLAIQRQHLAACCATHVSSLGDLKEPDLSYGPRLDIGAIRPPEITSWDEFHTLKIEIGVSRGWPCLNAKADHWATIPGVVYVLLLRISREMQNREYSFYEVHRPAVGPAFLVAAPANQQWPAPIERADAVVPTTIRLNARRLLALPAPTMDPAADALLQNFYPMGEVVINLTEIVDLTVRQR